MANASLQASAAFFHKFGEVTGIFASPLASVNLAPSAEEAWKPFYYYPHESLLPFLSDKYLSLMGPIVVYWGISLWFMFLDTIQLPFFEKYRLHEPEEVLKRNRVSASKVVAMVLLQQVIQTILGALVLEDEETVHKQVFADHGEQMRKLGVHLARFVCGTVGYKAGLRILDQVGVQAVQWLYWWGLPIAQFWWAFFVMDAWQYALHRAFHESRFLYRHFHSHHHRLYVPYAFGALYNHPLEGLLLDSAGAALSHAVALMTVRQGVLLFTFSTLKTVCDHGGYAFPWWLDPLHLVFPNCAEYHDVHHQMQGLRFNYSQPFFVHFDVVFGTRIGAEKFGKMKEANLKMKQQIRSSRGQSCVNGEKVVIPEEDEFPTTAIKDRSVTENNGLKKRIPGATDESTEDIMSIEKDPFVTTSMESYRAKAGNNTD